LDCGGKRSATPLSDRRKSGVALRLPPQSKSVHWQALIASRERLTLSYACARLITVLAFFSVVFTSAHAQLLVEHFTYSNGNLGGAGIGDAVWTGGDSPNVSLTVNSTAALSGAGLAGSGGSGIIFTGSTFKKKAAAFAAQTGNGTTVYCSFLLQIQIAPSGTKACLYLQNGNSASSSPPLGVFLDSSSHLGLGKSVSTPGATTAAALSPGVHLVVVCYTFQAGNDRVDLWLDPSSLGNTNTIPSPTLTTGTASSSDASALSYVFLNHAVTQTLWLDEVRVGLNWADVTPTTMSPPLSTAPRFTQVFMSPAGLVLRGSNGPVNGAFDLLAAGNPFIALAQWAEVASDTFDSNGRFDLTNPVSTASGNFIASA